MVVRRLLLRSRAFQRFAIKHWYYGNDYRFLRWFSRSRKIPVVLDSQKSAAIQYFPKG
jgi:hypothetical protein